MYIRKAWNQLHASGQLQMTLLYSEHRRLYFWSAIVMVCTTFLAFELPYGLELRMHPSQMSQVIYWFCNGVLIADIFVHLYRFRHDTSEGAPGIWTFLLSWVLIDILPAIPIEWIFSAGYLQLFRLVKLARVAQMIRMFKQAEVRFSITITLISFFYWAAILIHLLACGWLEVHGIVQASDRMTNYIGALYWVVTTLTSVGYGDILPVTNAERIYAMIVQVTGVAVFGYLVGNVVTILSKLDAGSARYKELVEMLGTAARRRGLSKDLQRRVLDYYRFMRDEKTGYDESAFLRTLPHSLRTQVALNLKKEFIENIPLFRNAGDTFIIDIALKLKLDVVTPGDYVFRADDPADKMYFVVSGELEVINKDETQVLAELKAGDFFGEIALFRNSPRSAGVRAVTYCNLYKLNRKTFESVMEQYPEIAKQIEREAIVREQRNDV